ncbi:uncharacterized protein ISCGN_032335, partial [Ixodes scapularis]
MATLGLVRSRREGLLSRGDGAGTTTVQRLQKAVSQVTHLVRRVADCKQGFKEQDSLRLVQALVVSRITYGTQYLGLRKSEREKIKKFIRKTYKRALGLPPTTSTDRVMQLGVYNVWEEMSTASMELRILASLNLVIVYLRCHREKELQELLARLNPETLPSA